MVILELDISKSYPKRTKFDESTLAKQVRKSPRMPDQVDQNTRQPSSPNPSLFWETWLRPTHMQQYILSECTFYSTKQHCKALAHLPFMFISPFHFKFFLRVCSLGLLPMFLNTNITFPQAISACVFVSLPCLHSLGFPPCFCLFSPVFPSSHLFNLPN